MPSLILLSQPGTNGYCTACLVRAGKPGAEALQSHLFISRVAHDRCVTEHLLKPIWRSTYEYLELKVVAFS
jgi:hypothetical protein